MRERVMSSVSGPVLLEPVGGAWFMLGAQPIDNLPLQDNSKRNTRAPQKTHDELVELLVRLLAVEILGMRSFLPRNAGKVRRTL
jgi:hypothetical protein